VSSEEIAQPTYFEAMSGDEIRRKVTEMVQGRGLFSFRQARIAQHSTPSTAD
jgi:hypothetical protein